MNTLKAFTKALILTCIMSLLITLVMLGTAVVMYGQASDACLCETVKKTTVNYCVGSRGGEYCIYTNRNGVEAKYYKPKTSTTQTPSITGSKTNPLVSTRGNKYYWRKSASGNWYRAYVR